MNNVLSFERMTLKCSRQNAKQDLYRIHMKTSLKSTEFFKFKNHMKLNIKTSTETLDKNNYS